MADSIALVWDLIARDNASGTFRKVGAEAEGASAGVGKLLGGFTALAAGAAIAASVKAASDFQAQMLLVQTQAGATAQEVADMGPKILTLAGQVAQAPEALATSLYHVESTGLRGSAALDAVRVAAEGAKVGHADLEQTTNALTATIASGMLPATETYTQAMGQLNTIVGSGDMKMSDLNEALGTGLLVTMKQYGVTVPDVGAALADFGDNNIRGADAATKLRMAVQAIESPAKGGQAALSKIGITSKQLADDMAKGGLNKALTDLHDHLVNSGIDSTQWGQLLTDAFTKKAGSGVLTLIGTFDRFQQKYQEVSKGADSFGSAWEATTKTADFQFSKLKDSVEAIGIKLGTALLPPLSDLAGFISGKLNDALTYLSDKGSAAGKMFSDIGGFIRTSVIPVISDLWHWINDKLVPVLVGIFRDAWNGIQSAIDTVTKAVQSHRSELGQVWSVIKDVVGWIVANVLPLLGTVLKGAFEFLGKAIGVVIDLVSSFVDAFNGAKSWFEGTFVPAFRTVSTVLQTVFETAVAAIGVAWDKVKQMALVPVAFVVNHVVNPFINGIDSVFDFLHLGWHINPIGGFAEGGYTGSGSKYQPAGVVHAGEFVIPKNVVDQTGPAVWARAAGLPGYADGGLVGNLAGLITNPVGTLQDFLKSFGSGGNSGPFWDMLISAPMQAIGAAGSAIGSAIKDGIAKLFWNPDPGAVSSLAKLPGNLGQLAQLSGAIGAGSGPGSFIGGLAGMNIPGAGSGAQQWRGVVAQVVAMLGLPTAAIDGILSMIQSESGGNPNAINLWDSNAQAGHPSQGLLQTIPSTFAAFAGPFRGLGITNPLANVYAGANYALHTYGAGMLTGGGNHNSSGRYIGYATGTNYVPNDGPAYLHKGEAVIPAAINAKMGGPVEITGTLRIDGDGLAHIVDGRIVSAGRQSSLASAAGSSSLVR